MKAAATAYKNEPRPAWWSPWRKWRRIAIAISPAAALIALLLTSLVAAIDELRTAPTTLIGAIVATIGGVLVQYIVFLLQAERDRRERYRREIAIATVLMLELGEALARLNVNVKILTSGNAALFPKLAEIPVASWDSVKLAASEFWGPESIMGLAEVYAQIRFSNAEIRGKTAQLTDPGFIAAYGAAAKAAAAAVKRLERRMLRAGRE